MVAIQLIKVIVSLFLVSTTIASNDKCLSNTISVTGVGRRNVRTTIAEITLGIMQAGPTAPMVQRALARKSSRLLSYLRQQQVSRLRTQGVSLSARFNFSTSPPQVVGYQGSNTITFEVAVSKAGIILDGSVRNGATRINAVSFKATRVASNRARKVALRDAVRMARMEAITVASASGKRLSRTLTVRVTDSFFPEPIRSRQSFQRSRALESRSTTPVIGGDQTVTARVMITYDSY